MRNDEFFVSSDLLNSYGFDLTSLDARMHIANHREGDTPRDSYPSRRDDKENALISTPAISC